MRVLISLLEFSVPRVVCHVSLPLRPRLPRRCCCSVQACTLVAVMTQLLDLPAQLLLSILTCLPPEDTFSRCAAAQSCTTLLDITSIPSLWTQQHQQLQEEGLIFKQIRLVLSRLLHLPPQAFVVQDDSKRSAKFCITAPMYSLRGLLGVSDVEDLAASTARSVQDKIDKFPSWLITHAPPASAPRDARHQVNGHSGGAAAAAGAAGGAAGHEPEGTQAAAAAAVPGQTDATDSRQLAPPVLPPYAVVQVCRSDRGTLRLSLNPAAVVKTVLENQLLGLPLLDLGPRASPAHPQGLPHPPPTPNPTPPEIPSLGQLFAYDSVAMSHVPLALLLPHGGEAVELPIAATSQHWLMDTSPAGQAVSGSEAGGGWSRLRSQLLRCSMRRTRALMGKRRQGSGGGQGDGQQVAALLRSMVQQQPQGRQQHGGAASTSTTSPGPGDHTLEEVWASIHLALRSGPRQEEQSERKAHSQGLELQEDEAGRLYTEAEAQVFASVAMRLMSLIDATARGRDPPVQPSLGITPARPPAAVTLAAAGGRTQTQAAVVPRLHGPAGAGMGGPCGPCGSLEKACRLSMQLRQLSHLWREIQAHAASHAAGDAPGIGGPEQEAAGKQPAPGSSCPAPQPPGKRGGHACLVLHELQAAVRQAGSADAQACLRCVSLLTEALARSAATGCPGPLLGLLEAAAGAAAEYSLPVREQSALGLALGGGGEGEYLEQLGRAVAADGELGCAEESLARMVMLRSCTQVAYWAAWCLGVLS